MNFGRRCCFQVPTPVQASDRSPAIIGWANELNTEPRWECSVFHRSMEKPRLKSDIHDTRRRCRLHCFLQHQRFHQECYRVRRLSNLPRPRWTCSLHGKRNQGQNYNLIYQSKAPRTESKKTRIKKNTATNQVNTLQSTTIAQRPTTAGNRQENNYERRPQQATQQARPQAAARPPAPLSVIYGPETKLSPIGILFEKQALPYRTIGSIIGGSSLEMRG